MTVTFIMEPADLKALRAYYRRRSPAMKRMWLISFVVAVGISLTHTWDRAGDPAQRTSWFLAYFIVIFGVMVLVNLLLRPVLNWRSFTPRQQPNLHQEHTVTLSETSLVEKTPITNSEFQWSGIHSVVDAGKHFFIFIAANMACVIPKRAFPDSETARAFFQRAKELYANAHPGG
jgi:hypothetical protein